MKKSELKEIIRECLREELAKANLKESVEEPIEKLAIVFVGNTRNEQAVLSKITEPRQEIVYSARDFIRQHSWTKQDSLEKSSVKFYADAEGMQELKDELAEVPARVSEPIFKVTTLLEGALTEADSAKQDVANTSAASTMPWDDLIEKANELLDELCIESDNTFWDDGDGYWSSDEGSEWTMRNLYYADTLTNIDELKKLCDEYSKKLPNVTFYYCEDDPVSEIGYTAVNVDYKGA